MSRLRDPSPDFGAHDPFTRLLLGVVGAHRGLEAALAVDPGAEDPPDEAALGLALALLGLHRFGAHVTATVEAWATDASVRPPTPPRPEALLR